MPQNAVLCGNGLMTKKNLDLSKLKALADIKIKVIQLLNFVFWWVENVIKTENCRFLVFTTCFSQTVMCFNNAYEER